MKLIPYKKEHLETIMFNELVTKEFNPKELIAASAEKAIAYTGITDADEVVFICGVTKLWSKVYEVWFLISDLFEKNARQSFKLVLKLKATIAHISYKRIQADINESIPKNIRFIEHLGYTFEGRMPKFGINGETYLRYALYGD